MAPLTTPSASRRRVRVRGSAVALGLVCGMLVLPACGTGRGGATTTFRRDGVDAPGVDPFTTSFGADVVGVQPPENASGAYSATTPGLYLDRGAVCDRAVLVASLEANPTVAAAWAGLAGIAPTDVAVHVATLTPVVLRTDTAVTSHGYEGGRTTSTSMVLQAGTAILADDRGAPAVQCRTGNVLTAAPSTTDAAYDGAGWGGFNPERVTTVRPAAVPMTSIVVADPTGTGLRRPVGTTGPEDGPYTPGEEEGAIGAATVPAGEIPPTEPTPGSDASTSEYPASARPGPDYPLDAGPNASADTGTTYLATSTPADDTGGAGAEVSDDCAGAPFLASPFTITVRVQRDGAHGDATVGGNGWNDGDVSIRSALPTRDLHDAVSRTGTFSVGGSRRYDTDVDQGEFTARWSGNVGTSRTPPASFPLTIRRTWVRDSHFVAWLVSSGGPDDSSCAYVVTATRQR